jgi:hypothetical protein
MKNNLISEFENRKILKSTFWIWPMTALFVFVCFGFWIFSEPLWTYVCTVIGITFTLFGVWITLKIYEFGNKFNGRLESAIDTVHKMILTSLKAQYLENLRNQYFSTPEGSSQRRYWNFIWRFETFDSLMLGLESNCAITVRILFKNEKPFKVGLEDKKREIYTTRITKVFNTTEFIPGEIVYCTAGNDSLWLSKESNELDLFNPIVFTIDGLGDPKASAVCPEVPRFERIKDVDTF